MAKNKTPWDNQRKWAVKGREQYYNPKTNQWFKADSDTWKIMDVKEDWTPFKGVRKH